MTIQVKLVPNPSETNSPEFSLKFLLLALHLSYFLAATLDFASFSQQLSYGPHTLGWVLLDEIMIITFARLCY